MALPADPHGMASFLQISILSKLRSVQWPSLVRPLAILLTTISGWTWAPVLIRAQGDFQPRRTQYESQSPGPIQRPVESQWDRTLDLMSPSYWGAEGPTSQTFPQPYGPSYQLPPGQPAQQPNASRPAARGSAPTNPGAFQPASSQQSIMSRPGETVPTPAPANRRGQVWESKSSNSGQSVQDADPLLNHPDTLPGADWQQPVPGFNNPVPSQAQPNFAPAPHWTVPIQPDWNAQPQQQYQHPQYQPQPYQVQEPQATVPFASEPSLFEKGFRSLEPTQRPESWDSGQRFAFEEKKGDYPPLSEILATGRYFVMTEWQLLRPQITALGGITLDSGAVRRTLTLDYEPESVPRFRAGFESKLGPGVEFEYFQFDHNSRPLNAVSTPGESIRSQVELPATGSFSSLQSTAAGQLMNVRHDLELHVLGMSFFKEFKLPKARMNGTFGWRYASIAQTYLARLSGGGNAEIGRLLQTTDFRGFGPRFGFEYYRPIGHTRLEFLGSFNTSLLYGNRDQIVFNTQQGYDERLGANEFLANIDIFGGAQYVHHVGENRAVYARLGLTTQTWLGGGNGQQADGDFGLRGLSFAVGWNR